jgi:hypothetical protein
MENKCVKVTAALVDLLHQRMKKRDPVKELAALKSKNIRTKNSAD